MLDKSNLFQSSEKAILVGVALKEQKDHQVNEYLDALAFLATTAGAVTAKTFIQKLQHPDSKTYIGKGKLEEIKNYAAGKDISVLIFDDELTGAQISNKHVLALTNSGDATAGDIIELAKMARAKVFEKFGVRLEAEVQLVGLDLN